MYCLEARGEMPALPEEIAEAEGEAIAINNSWGPKRILTEGGKVTAVEFKKCLSVFDAEKKFHPVYDEEETVIVPAETVLLSVGQSIEWGSLLEGSKVQTRPNQTALADSFTLQSDESDIFVGGDALTGPKFAIDAIALGKEASISIHRFVQPGQSLVIGRDRKIYTALDKESVIFGDYDNSPRQRSLDDHSKKLSFSDNRGTFSEEQVKKETERCLGCGATVVDEFLCVGCGQCTTKCKFEAITLKRKYDGEGVSYEQVKPAVMKTVIKRKIRITAQKVQDAFTAK
jgi:ferredoxin